MARAKRCTLAGDELRRLFSTTCAAAELRRASARCWLLVEGETEYWLMSELSRVCGYDLASEGVACVEFAQCRIERHAQGCQTSRD